MTLTLGCPAQGVPSAEILFVIGLRYALLWTPIFSKQTMQKIGKKKARNYDQEFLCVPTIFSPL